MTELKTLKDLKVEIKGKVIVNLISKKQLKQEAIKWIKELAECGSHTKENHVFYRFRHDTYPIVDFIVDRFNITDEDLK